MKFDIIIIGSGLAGASLACALRGSRYRIALLEKQPPEPFISEGWDARVYAISPANVEFLSSIGIWRNLDCARIGTIEQMQIYGDNNGQLAFSAYESGMTNLANVVESRHLAHELWQTVRRQTNIEFICPASPEVLTLEDAGVRLQLQDGRVLEADLIVAADGANSWVRQQAGIHAEISAYAEEGVVANFKCAEAHHNTAYQWFNAQGVLAYLPLPENQISIVWSTDSTHAQYLLNLPHEQFCAEVERAGQHRLGKLSLVTSPAAFPLRLTKVEQMVKKNIALIGDAAHTVHPLSGHGINLGFQDARELAVQLMAWPALRRCGELNVLRRYARARAEEVFLVQSMTHSLRQLFKPQSNFLSRLRNTGLDLTQHLPFARSMLIRYASGLI